MNISRKIFSLGLFADGTYGDGLNNVASMVKGLFYGGGLQFAAQVIGVIVNFVSPAGIRGGGVRRPGPERSVRYRVSRLQHHEDTKIVRIMKKIEAIVKRFKLDVVKDALNAIGFRA